jgi:hypothetical protein
VNGTSLDYVSNSLDENNFGVSSTFGAGNTKIVFLKASLWLAFKKTIFIMRIAMDSISSVRKILK